MQESGAKDREVLEALGRKHGFSGDAAGAVLRALIKGSGRMAQFDHPELGGMGQWSAGGMTQIGAMSDHALKARVAALCDELARHLDRAHQGGDAPDGSAEDARASWWPAGLGHPASSGSQNDWRYAYFPAERRLALDSGDRIRVYDTGDHEISGVSQQQGAGSSISFRSQKGSVPLEELREVDPSA